MATICLLFLSLLISFVTFGPQSAAATNIGICYGRHGGRLPSPADAVRIYVNKQFGRMRIYDPHPPTLLALHGTTIQLTVGVRNNDIHYLSCNKSAAGLWIHRHILPHVTQINFRYIVVGEDYVRPDTASLVYSAMSNLYAALARLGLDEHIKVTTAITASVLGVSFPPSQGYFASQCPGGAAYMQPIVELLEMHGAPLLVNVYPYYYYSKHRRDIPLSYALLKSNKTVTAGGYRDGGHVYTNLFDAMVDVFHVALEKAGVHNVRVAVSETGWPTAGGHAATLANAKYYTWNLIQHVLSTRGTPRRPGAQIETYLFSLFNEDKRSTEVARHFGLFHRNNKPVYSLPPL